MTAPSIKDLIAGFGEILDSFKRSLFVFISYMKYFFLSRYLFWPHQNWIFFKLIFNAELHRSVNCAAETTYCVLCKVIGNKHICDWNDYWLRRNVEAFSQRINKEIKWIFYLNETSLLYSCRQAYWPDVCFLLNLLQCHDTSWFKGGRTSIVEILFVFEISNNESYTMVMII